MIIIGRQAQKFILLLVFAVFLIVANSHAWTDQKIDSLKTIERSLKSPSLLSSVCYNLSENYFRYDLDSSLIYSTKSLDYAIQSRDTIGIANAHSQMGYIYDALEEFDKALSHFKQSLHFFSLQKDTAFMAHCLHNIGYVVSKSFDQTLSLSYYIKSINLAEAIKDTIALTDSYADIGDFYEYVENYETAEYYLKKSIEFKQNSISQSDLAFSLAQLANVQLMQDKDSIAKESIHQAGLLLPEIEDLYSLGLTYTQFVDFYVTLKNADASQHYIALSESIFQRSSNTSMRAAVLKQKGDLDLLNKSYWSSIEHYNESFDLYNSVKNPESFSEIYKLKSAAYANLGSYQKAHEALQTSNAFADSVNMEEISRMLGEFDQTRKTKSEQLTAELQRALEQKVVAHRYMMTRNNLKISVIALIFLVILSSLSIYFFLQIRKRNSALEHQNQTIDANRKLLEENIQVLQIREKELNAANASKNKLFSIIAHDLRNPFNTLLGFSELMVSNPDIGKSKNFGEIAKSMYSSAHTGFKLLENLLDWARSQMGQINHEPELLRMEDIILHNISQAKETAGIKGIDLKFVQNTSDYHHTFADLNMLNTVIRNLISNAIKFSHKNKEVHISLSTDQERIITSIKDFGIGMTLEEQEKLFSQDLIIRPGTNNEKGTGLGLMLCKEFVEKNQGHLSLHCKKDEGCTISFSLPSYNSKNN